MDELLSPQNRIYAETYCVMFATIVEMFDTDTNGLFTADLYWITLTPVHIQRSKI